MPDTTIGGWTRAQLNKFIVNTIATEPLNLPKSITVPVLHVTQTLYVEGDIQFSPQAKLTVHNA